MALRYLGFLSLPSSIATMTFGVGVAAAVLDWLSYRAVKGAILRGAGASTGALLLLLFSLSCWQSSPPVWWSLACILAGLAAGTYLVLRAKGLRNRWLVGGCGLLAGLLVRFLLEFALRPYAVLAVKYTGGYGLSLLAPVAVAAVCVFAVAGFLRPPGGPFWLLAAFVYTLCGAIFLFAAPLLPATLTQYSQEFLLGAAPCLAGVLVFGIRRDLLPRLLSVVVLYAFAGIVLFRAGVGSGPSPAQGLTSLLLSPAAAGFCCIVLMVLVGVHLYRVSKSGFEAASAVPMWVVATPWVSLIPAFYFAGLGTVGLLAFVFWNLLVGSAMTAVFASRFGALRLAAAGSKQQLSPSVVSVPQPSSSGLPAARRPGGGFGRKVLSRGASWTRSQRELAAWTLVAQLLVTVAFAIRPGPTPPPRVLSFAASTQSVPSGGGARLTWSVADATSVTLSPGPGAVASKGVLDINPGVTTVYVLSARGPQGSATSRVQVEVLPPAQQIPAVTVQPPADPGPKPIKRTKPQMSPEQVAEIKRQQEELARNQAELERQQAEAAAAKAKRAKALEILNGAPVEKNNRER